MRYAFAAIIMMFCAASHAADEIRKEVWSKRPINLTLPVGDDILVLLPQGDKEIAIPESLVGKLENYVVANSVYLKALQSFGPTLIPVKDVDSHEHVILKVSASNEADAYDLQIIDGTREIDTGKPAKAGRVDVKKALIQHAAQSLYAPQRLMPSNPRIIGTSLAKRNLYVRILIDFDPVTGEGGVCANTNELVATPIHAWRSGNSYVTAVRVENLTDRVVHVDPRGCHLQGDFTAFSAQHWVLSPRYEDPCAGEQKESGGSCNTKRTFKEVTTFYYTSEKPFWEAARHEN